MRSGHLCSVLCMHACMYIYISLRPAPRIDRKQPDFEVMQLQCRLAMSVIFIYSNCFVTIDSI